MRTALYRYFSKDKDLLYVGVSNNPFRRASQHGYWEMDEVAEITISWFSCRDEALAEESVAIQTECPIWNIKGEPINFHDWKIYAFSNNLWPFNIEEYDITDIRIILKNIYQGCVSRGWYR